MDLRELQAQCAARFAEQDQASGLPFLVSVLAEEVGELAKAARRGQREEVGQEAVDVLFMALSVCNAVGFDAEAQLRAKFLERSTAEVTRTWEDVPEPAPAISTPRLLELVHEFAHAAPQRPDLYNEDNLKHELRAFLASRLPGLRVELERNVRALGISKENLLKSEMDVCVYDDAMVRRYCIELKFPRQRQYPEQMFAACKDVRFLEQLVEAGFDGGVFMMVADDRAFWGDKPGEGIYDTFRVKKRLEGEIRKPTGARDEVLVLRGRYPLEWRLLKEQRRYFAVGVAGGTP